MAPKLKRKWMNEHKLVRFCRNNIVITVIGLFFQTLQRWICFNLPFSSSRCSCQHQVRSVDLKFYIFYTGLLLRTILRTVWFVSTPLTPPGAQEIVYAQVGQTVTLKPPANFKSLKYYLTWTFGEAEIAWSNYLNGNQVTAREWHI